MMWNALFPWKSRLPRVSPYYVYFNHAISRISTYLVLMSLYAEEEEEIEMLLENYLQRLDIPKNRRHKSSTIVS